jgi:alkaline phosphatase D
MLTQGLAGLQQRPQGAELRIHQQVAWGRLATLHLLDGRQYRDRQACLRDGGSLIDPAQCPEWAEPQRSYLGAAQEQWLEQALGRSAGRWNVVGQQTLFGPRDARPGPGQRFWNDGWDGYPAARTRLLDALQRQRVSNPVFLGGDVHENWVGHVKADYSRADSAAIGVEFCGTSISSRASASGIERAAERLAENPHFIYGEARYRGYGLAEFTPQRLRTTLRAVDDVTRADSAASTQAQFEVLAGRARIERV